jgi:hypothetical protein
VRAIEELEQLVASGLVLRVALRGQVDVCLVESAVVLAAAPDAAAGRSHHAHQPTLEAAVLAQLAQVLGGDQERVLNGVFCLGLRAAMPPPCLEQALAVATGDLVERLAAALANQAHQPFGAAVDSDRKRLPARARHGEASLPENSPTRPKPLI